MPRRSPKFLKLHPSFRIWLAIATASTILAGLVYVAVQQDLRQSANDPQIQLANDAASALNSGKNAAEVLTGDQIDAASSLAPFLILYDESGRAVTGSGQINGQLPAPPTGVFSYSKAHGADRLTWQPDTNIRLAAVVVPYQNGYVLSARSLREVENREAQTELLVFICWLGALAGSAAVLRVLPAV